MGQALPPWLYDPKYSYADNLKYGPFGDFDKQIKYKNSGKPKYDFFGTPVYSPFGIAAGPLPKAKFIVSALDRGFDIVTFKTVRSHQYSCHDYPNVYPLDTGDINLLSSRSIKVRNNFEQPLTIANSFGIPSFEPEVWQQEIKKSIGLLGEGQALLPAFQGTIPATGGHKAFINDHIEGIGKLVDIGAEVIELNLSCPNEGHCNLLCFDLKATRDIVRKIIDNYPKLKLITKISYISDDKYLKDFVKQIAPMVAGITAINTVPQNIVGVDGRQVFYGDDSRLQAGVSGAAIKSLAVDMVRRLKKHRGEFGYDFKIIGVGGVLNAQDFHEHLDVGADFVMGLTGVMWNPNLAAEIKASL